MPFFESVCGAINQQVHDWRDRFMIYALNSPFQMAGELLMSVSKDEKERAIFRIRRMYQSDLESSMATAEERGGQE